MKTYKQLFLSIQSLPDPNILNWLMTDKWKGKDKQETILRLFARLGLIPKINHFHMCSGNFNINTIKTQVCIRDIFLTPKNKEVCLNDKGDSSDLTGIHKINPKHLLVCTSKCINHLSLKKLDIDYISTNFKQYDEKGYTMTLCIVVKDAQEFNSKLERSERTTTELKKFIQSHNTIVIDWNDLNEAYHNFKSIYGKISFNDLIAVKKSPLVLRLHQKLCCMKTMRLKSLTNKILWGHIQRSGKSYIIGGVIIDDSKEKSKCNYLVMTTAPNETIIQYLQVFGCSQFGDFNVVHLDGKSRKPTLKDKNIIICSKQFLQTKFEKGHDKQKHTEEKTRSISWLKNMKFDMRFVDESHNGGTTELAQKTLDYYGNGSFTIYITATYSKPTQDYNIPREHWILWDLEDINLCKQIDKENNVERLVEKHGDDIQHLLQQYSTENIIADFSKYPDLDILTMNISSTILPEILKETRDNLYGWSPDACFLLKQGVDDKNNIVYQLEFQNKEENLKLWHTIFGKQGKFGIPDKNYPDELVFMKRIEKICKNPITSSRFVGDLDQNVVMAFLPPNNIDLVSQATKQLLEDEKVVPDYDILCINSKTTTDPKQSILDAKIRAKNCGKKGVLVLSGRQCSLGVTIDDCDIVLLLNNSNSYDMIFQMMFRCMTEGEGKKRGFVIDPNIHRVVETILLEYGSIVKPDFHPKDAIRYLLQERLINLNSDHWKPCFGHGSSQLITLTNSIHEVYSSRMSGALENLFRRMSLKQNLFSKNEYDMMKTIFLNHHLSKENKKKLLEELEQAEEEIKKGIEKTQVSTEQQQETEKEEKRIDPIDILRPISIVISLLTIHDNDKSTLEEMFSLVEDNKQKKSILLNQVRVWWGKGVSNKDVEELVRIFRKYLEKDNQTTMIIRQVKELFCKNIKNSKELSQIIDKYLIPQENEKKKNAEVSTPRHLRQDMLEKIPVEFWKEKRKVFEPCCGKGGFLMDIVDKFMTGLKGKYPDEKQRYKDIVENCLYFSDINDMNIFICRLLLDPYNEYKLKYNEGNTLELNIKEKWGLKGFDAVIGNPPYNLTENSRNIIWNRFVENAIDQYLIMGGYLLFVHPALWRKPVSTNSKLCGLYKKMIHKNTMIYLEIHGTKDGMKTFHCGTRYDFYLLKKGCLKHESTTTIVDEDGNTFTMDLKSLKLYWLPNKSFDVFSKITSNQSKVNIMYSRSAYGNDKKWMSRVKTESFKYPCVLSTPTSGLRYMYSNINTNGHFGIPKVIFGETGTQNGFYDVDGMYGQTDGVMSIVESNPDIAQQILKCIKSKSFNEFLSACSWSNYRIEWNMFLDIDYDFWKHFK